MLSLYGCKHTGRLKLVENVIWADFYQHNLAGYVFIDLSKRMGSAFDYYQHYK